MRPKATMASYFETSTRTPSPDSWRSSSAATAAEAAVHARVVLRDRRLGLHRWAVGGAAREAAAGEHARLARCVDEVQRLGSVLRVGPRCAEGDDTKIDERAGGIAARGGRRRGTFVLDEQVGAVEEPCDGLPALVGGGVGLDAELAGVQIGEEAAAFGIGDAASEWPLASSGVARSGALDLDDLRAESGQQPPAEGAGDTLGALYDTDAREHRAAPVSSRTAA